MISITIPVISGDYINEVLRAIYASNYQDFEVIVQIDKENDQTIETLRQYDCHVFHGKSGLLASRYQMHKESIGDYELMLDETRVIDGDLLLTLSDSKSEMVVIPETELSSNWLGNLGRFDKDISGLRDPDLNPLGLGYVLPRYFKRSLLDNAFSNIKTKLPYSIFQRVIHPDHQIIYYEAHQSSASIEIARKGMIRHYSDLSFTRMWKKYMKYGASGRLLKGTEYSKLLSIEGYRREVNSQINRVVFSNLLLILHAVPYFVGFYISYGSFYENSLI